MIHTVTGKRWEIIKPSAYCEFYPISWSLSCAFPNWHLTNQSIQKLKTHSATVKCKWSLVTLHEKLGTAYSEGNNSEWFLFRKVFFLSKRVIIPKFLNQRFIVPKIFCSERLLFRITEITTLRNKTFRNNDPSG